MTKRNSVTALLTVMCLLLVSFPVRAADDAKAAKAEMKRLQQAQRKLEQEKSALQAQVEEAGGKLNKVQKTAAAAARRATDLEARLKATEEARDQLTVKVADGEKRLVEQVEANRQLSEVGSRLKAELAHQAQATSACEAKNLQLYGYGRELLQRYERKGVWDVAAQAEPFTGLKRVEMENLLDEYRDKLDAQKASAPVADAPLPIPAH